MRISELSRFPHPVLAPESGDFVSGEFDIDFEVEEKPTSGELSIEYKITLTQDSISELVTSGDAIVGMFVSCEDTFHRELRPLSWPSGRTDFAPGVLLNRVQLRPLVWLKVDLPSWSPEGMHPEFGTTVSLSRSSILAIGTEQIYSVGLAKLAELESVFELKPSESVQDGFAVDPDSDRIVILVASKLYETICILRQQQGGSAALMNGVFLPAVMELLDILSAGGHDFYARRWHPVFIAKCDRLGIDPSTQPPLLKSAQALLGFPTVKLTQLTVEEGGA